MRAEIPPPGYMVSLSLLGEISVYLDVLAVIPIPSPNEAVKCTEDTRVFLIPALPPSLLPMRLIGLHPSCLTEGRELPALIRMGLKGGLVLDQTGFSPPRSFLITGEYGCGKTSIVAHSVYAAGAKLLRVSASDLLRTVATEDGMLHAMRYHMSAAGASKPSALLLDDAQFLFPPEDDNAAAAFSVAMDEEHMRTTKGFVVVLCCSSSAESIHRRIIEACDTVIPVSLDPEGRTSIEIASTKSGHPYNVIKKCVGLANVETVTETIERAKALGEGRQPIEDEVKEDRQENRDILRKEQLEVRWADMSTQLGGLKGPQTILKRIFLWRQTKAQTFATLGLNASVGVLLYGCPGTGKTALIRQAAAAAQFNMISVSAASLARGEVGESERLLAETFKKARRSIPCVIFIDEIDALFATATATSPHLVRLVASFSLLLDNIFENIVVVGATNRPWMVSAGLLRPGRFEHCVKVSLPNALERGQIAAVYAVKMQLQSEEEHRFQTLMRSSDAEGLSGADIAGFSRRAVMSALCRGSKIGFADLEKAFESTFPSVSQTEAARLDEWQPPR